MPKVIIQGKGNPRHGFLEMPDSYTVTIEKSNKDMPTEVEIFTVLKIAIDMVSPPKKERKKKIKTEIEPKA
jgi:hypothetical protein